MEPVNRSESIMHPTTCHHPPYLFLLFALCSWTILVAGVGVVAGAGGDCMGASRSEMTLECFECNSWSDPRCHDRFNYTIRDEDMPPVKECRGCCVKMFQFIGTEHYQVRRTCTDSLDINFFMVNHGCMIEGHRHGHMCFCEEDRCNSAWSTVSIGSSPPLLLLLLTIPVVATMSQIGSTNKIVT